MTPRERVRFWFEDLETPMGRLVDLLVLVFILLGCVLVVLETYTLGAPWDERVVWLEWFVMGVFMVEYALRFWSAEGRWEWAISPYALIDLLALLPALVVVTPHFAVFRVLRVLRVMRLLRFLEDQKFFFGTVRPYHLGVLRIAFTIVAIIFIASGLIWHVESANPDADIKTFGEAVYFSVVTVTTVGYGDQVPVTPEGRLVTLLMIAAGFIFIPWQIKEMIATGMTGSEERSPDCPRCGLRRHPLKARYCHRCGEALHPGVAQAEPESPA